MVRLRLKRGGTKKKPFYRVVAIDSRKKRDGSAIDILGYLNPLSEKLDYKLDVDKIVYWYKNGAKPTDRVYQLMRESGITKVLRGEVSAEEIKNKIEEMEISKQKSSSTVEIKKETTSENVTKEEPKAEIEDKNSNDNNPKSETENKIEDTKNENVNENDSDKNDNEKKDE